VNTPPKIGPTALAKAHTIPIIPKYGPRFRILNKSLIQILTKIIRPPPPMPCIALAKINIPILTLTAASKLPRKNIAAAINNTGLRPQISENFPHEGVLAALASRYADPIQVYPAFEWKYSLMVGRAVVMIVVSRAARKTDAPSEAMIILVCSFVREASGSLGEGALGSMAAGEGAASSSSMLVEESFGMSFSEGEGVGSRLACC
jgi:hypothetical protein